MQKLATVTMLPHRMVTSHFGLHFLIQLPADLHPERQQVMAQTLEPLSQKQIKSSVSFSFYPLTNHPCKLKENCYYTHFSEQLRFRFVGTLAKLIKLLDRYRLVPDIGPSLI